MDDLVERLRARAEFEDARVLKEVMRDGFEPVAYTGSESGRMLREAADALEAARSGVTSPATSTVTTPDRILIDAIEYEIRQLEGKANWKSQTARIASLRAAIDAAREASNG